LGQEGAAIFLWGADLRLGEQTKATIPFTNTRKLMEKQEKDKLGTI
jgi:hypothetical protein